MKTTLLTIAATMIASTTAFANDDLFDVNDAPANYETRLAQSLDFEPTAANPTAPYGDVTLNYEPMDNDKLFD